MKTFAQQLEDLKATKSAKASKMQEIAKAAANDPAGQRSMNTAEAEEFDTLDGEVKRLEQDEARIARLAAMDLSSATPVDDSQQRSAPAAGGSGALPVQLKTVEKLDKGIGMARYVMALTKAKGDPQMAFKLAEKYFPQTESVVRLLKAQSEGANLEDLMKIKATVAAGDTINATWAAPLVDQATIAGEFLEYLRPRTLIGQANFRPVMFNVRIGSQTGGGTAYWVGQGKAKPVTALAFGADTIPFSKVATIAVITQELARFSDPKAEAIVRDTLADAVIERIDTDLFDPDKAAVANVSPAGLLNGVTPVTVQPIDPSDPESIACALMALWAPWDSTNLGARPAYYTTPAIARLLAFRRYALSGQSVYPNMTPTGGSIDGIPVRVSQYLANNGGSGGAPFILVDESEVYLADDGSVTVDASEQASIEMSDTPAGSSNPTVAASSVNLVSMWQTNSIAIRAERYIWWGKRRVGAVQWIDGFPTAC